MDDDVLKLNMNNMNRLNTGHVKMPVKFIMTNGMSRTVTAKVGVNVYPAGHGIHIVRAAGQVAKLKN